MGEINTDMEVQCLWVIRSPHPLMSRLSFTVITEGIMKRDFDSVVVEVRRCLRPIVPHGVSRYIVVPTRDFSYCLWREGKECILKNFHKSAFSRHLETQSQCFPINGEIEKRLQRSKKTGHFFFVL